MRRLILFILLVLVCNVAQAGFNGYLKADTQVIVTIGPFVDVGDGFTPQVDIGNPDTNLTGVDEAELLKHGSVTTVDITARTWVAIASVDGYYGLTLTTDDTNTEGMLTIIIQDDSDCLPVRCSFMVVNDNSFEAFFENAAELLTVNLTQIGAGAQSATDLKDFADAGYNPATDKVTGVLLTDTVTTYTGNTKQTADNDTLLTTIDGKVDTAQTDLDTITGGSGVLIDTDAVDADAVKADTWTELLAVAFTDIGAGAPSATCSWFTGLNRLYMAWRNKTITNGTNSEIEFYNNANIKIMESDINDDGTDFIRGEIGAVD